MTPLLKGIYGSQGGSECLDVLMKYMYASHHNALGTIQDQILTCLYEQLQGHGGWKPSRRLGKIALQHDTPIDGLHADERPTRSVQRVGGGGHERPAQLAREVGRGRGTGKHWPNNDGLA
jgi:hypothetical protein